MGDTIFTKIINREIPSNIIYEDIKHIAILDITPFEKGHTLVIPKKQYETIMDMPENEFIELMKIVQKIAKYFEKELSCGISIWQNNKEIGEQLIKHVHFHIVPRQNKNKKFDLMENREKYLNGEIENYYNKLKLK